MTGGVLPGPGSGSNQRIVEVWAHVATKAGWSIEIVADFIPEVPADFTPGVDAKECGAVEIEGIRYVVKYGRRVRTKLFDDSTGSVVVRPVLGHAAWVEPVVTPLD